MIDILDKAKEKELIEEKVVEEPKQEVVEEEAKEFGKDDYVKVYSLRYGNLTLRSADTHIPDTYVFNGYMDVQDVRFEVLQSLQRRSDKCLTLPWIYISDEDAIKQLRLDRAYKNILTPDKIKEVFNSNDKKLLEFINMVDDNTKKTLREIAIGKINSEEITNFGTIRLLQDELKINMKEDIR